MTYCFFLPTTIILDNPQILYKNYNKNKQLVRIQQYNNGITKFLEFNKHKNIDTYLSDNSKYLLKDSEFKQYLEKNNIKIINNAPNKYGFRNKGAGIIENWLFNIDLLLKYDYIIHFEPRQLLKNNNLINNFIQNPRNIFTLGKNNRHFNTGLFTIETKQLLKFIKTYTSEYLVKKTVSLEYAIFNFIVQNKVKYSILDKMDLVWHDYFINTYKDM